jgi:hypothetical protein
VRAWHSERETVGSSEAIGNIISDCCSDTHHDAERFTAIAISIGTRGLRASRPERPTRNASSRHADQRQGQR